MSDFQTRYNTNFRTKHNLLTHSHLIAENIWGPDIPRCEIKDKYRFKRKTEPEPEQQIFDKEAAWWLGPLTSTNVYEKKRLIDRVPFLKKEGILPKENKPDKADAELFFPEALRKSPDPPTKRRPHKLAPVRGWKDPPTGRLPSPVNWQEPFSPHTPSTKMYPTGRIYRSTPAASNPAMAKQAGREVYDLKEETFATFLGDKDVALLMFYKPQEAESKNSEKEFLKAAKLTSREGAVFASINCSKNYGLCWNEDVLQTPAFKVFSRGHLVAYFRDVKDVNAKFLSEYVNRTPVLTQKGPPPRSTPYDNVLDRGFVEESNASRDSDLNDSLDQTLGSDRQVSKCKRRWGLISKCIGRG